MSPSFPSLTWPWVEGGSVQENALQKSIILMQQNSAHFEEGIVRSIQSAWQTFDEWQTRMSASVQETWRTLGSSMASLAPDREWIAFSVMAPLYDVSD